MRLGAERLRPGRGPVLSPAHRPRHESRTQAEPAPRDFRVQGKGCPDTPATPGCRPTRLLRLRPRPGNPDAPRCRLLPMIEEIAAGVAICIEYK